MQKIIILIACLSVGLVACKTDKSQQEQEGGITIATPEMVSYGLEIDPNNAESLEKMYQQLVDQDSINVKISGDVSEVCQVKGCWMTITEEGQPDLHVNFRDYGFFMPKDLDGSHVVAEGTVYRTVLSVSELRHLAEDSGSSEEEIAAITEPSEEIVFTADGVTVVK